MTEGKQKALWWGGGKQKAVEKLEIEVVLDKMVMAVVVEGTVQFGQGRATEQWEAARANSGS